MHTHFCKFLKKFIRIFKFLQGSSLKYPTCAIFLKIIGFNDIKCVILHFKLLGPFFLVYYSNSPPIQIAPIQLVPNSRPFYWQRVSGSYGRQFRFQPTVKSDELNCLCFQPTVSGLQPCSNKVLTISTLLLPAAKWIGNEPWSSGKVMLAPAFNSVKTQSRWPSWHAACNGVDPK